MLEFKQKVPSLTEFDTSGLMGQLWFDEQVESVGCDGKWKIGIQLRNDTVCKGKLVWPTILSLVDWASTYVSIRVFLALDSVVNEVFLKELK